MMKKKTILSGEKITEQKSAQKCPFMKRIFIDPQGNMRIVWMIACALFVYRGVSFAVRLGLGRTFAALFSAWRVNAGNIHRAPVWAQWIFSWHTSFITVAVCLILMPVSLFLRRWLAGRKDKIKAPVHPSLLPAVAGGGIALCLSVIFLLLDSMRLEWPLNRPAFSATVIFMLPVTLLTALSEELFTKCVVFDSIRIRKSPVAAVSVSALIFFFLNGGYAGNVFSGINVLLMGIVCCILYVDRGLWASVMFRGVWSYISVFVLGVSASGPVYAMYRVSDAWFTGGDGGMICGFGMTVVLVGFMVWMRRKSVAEWLAYTVRKIKLLKDK